ncbi:MAG: autotransporter outer membrane beta-barrel domain-containing protein [Xanthobacteraceae bacterium]|nr:autotransporter outer membrane beta-barrel domain-containing protein [Xanthobacteraceae bacterium]
MVVRIVLRIAFLSATSGAVFAGTALPAWAQANVWDSTISNTHWYVPVPQLLAYIAPRASLANPVPIGDQTLWMLGISTNGSFTGTSVAQLAIGPALLTETTTIQGTVTPSGQITMIFTPVGGGTATVGLGMMQNVGGVTSMEMQMITGDALLVTHWAYMLPYDPATFTPPASQVVLSNSSPQWAWTAGTPWRMVSPVLFGTSAPGRFVILDYQNGYFWGRGVGPNGSGPFTLLGSITPEGKVLLSTVSQGNLTSLYGNISGGPASSQMLLSEYDSLGNLTGVLATTSLVRPFVDVAAETNNRSALGAAATLYRLAGTPAGLSGVFAPALDALTSLSGPALSNAISQTLPVLAGSASQATYNTQRAFQQAVLTRLDTVRGTGLKSDLGVERNFWVRPLGGVMRQSGLDGVPGYRASGGGLAAGVDQTLFSGLTLGGVVAYSYNSLTGNDDVVPNTLGIRSYYAGIYGAYALRPDLDVNFQLDAALNRNSESRSISFMNSTASASYSGTTTHAGLGINKKVSAGPGLTLIPSLRMDLAQVRSGSYSEGGVDALNLNVDSQVYRELMLTAAIKSAYQIAGHVHLTSHAGIGYNPLNSAARITASYAGGGGSFVVDGLDVSPWLLSTGVGLVGIRKDHLDLGVHYDLQASPTGFLNQIGSLVLKMKI